MSYLAPYMLNSIVLVIGPALLVVWSVRANRGSSLRHVAWVPAICLWSAARCWSWHLTYLDKALPAVTVAHHVLFLGSVVAFAGRGVADVSAGVRTSLSTALCRTACLLLVATGALWLAPIGDSELHERATSFFFFIGLGCFGLMSMHNLAREDVLSWRELGATDEGRACGGPESAPIRLYRLHRLLYQAVIAAAFGRLAPCVYRHRFAELVDAAKQSGQPVQVFRWALAEGASGLCKPRTALGQQLHKFLRLLLGHRSALLLIGYGRSVLIGALAWSSIVYACFMVHHEVLNMRLGAAAHTPADFSKAAVFKLLFLIDVARNLRDSTASRTHSDREKRTS